MVFIRRTHDIARRIICQYPKTRRGSVGANSMDGAGFRGRLFLAWSLWQVKHQQKLTQGRLGEMLGEVGGEPVAQNTISSWFSRAMPDVHDIEYLAKALEVDPGWLAFGEASTAKGPDDPSRPDPMPRKPR
jgi:hypothetical protein